MEVERLQAVLEMSGLASFRANAAAADSVVDQVKGNLETLQYVSKTTNDALNKIKLVASQAVETGASAEFMRKALEKIASEATKTEETLNRVKIGAGAAFESNVNGDLIDRKVKDIGRQADETTGKLEVMNRAANGSSGGGGGGGITRMGLLGAAIGGGTLLGPAAGPAALGLLSTLPALAATGGGALGTLMLAFQGVTGAIGGDKKAFDALGPSAQAFVETVRSLTGFMHGLEATAQDAMFPGLTAALHSALSPGTVDAVTTAIKEFGGAIGEAGEQWGKYFGSSEFQGVFGPLMKEGAQDIGTMSSAALSLFDALGVLGRAAGPLTAWITQSIASGSAWVDVWLRGKDATGQLSGAMDEARTSLTLVAKLVESLGNAVGALGGALYPVSKVAVKDLTDGLNALADIIDRNQKGIQNVVGGALAALVQTVRIASPIVALLAHGLSDVAQNVGGWKNAFQIVLAGVLIAQLGTLLDKVKGIATAIGLIPAAAKTAATETTASLGKIGSEAETTRTKVAGIKTALSSIAGMTVTAAIILSLIPKSSTGQQALDNAGLGALGNLPIVGGAATQAGAIGNALRGALGKSTVGGPGDYTGALSPAAAAEQAQEKSFATGMTSTLNAAGSLASGKQKMLALAQAAIGTPYLWGGNAPGGFDCSGLVQWAFANGLNVSIPHSTYQQATMGAAVATAKAKVGDVVFTNYGETEHGVTNSGPGHEGLIVGFDKNGQPIVESAPQTGQTVHDSSLSQFVGGGRYQIRDLLAKSVPGAGGGTGGDTSVFGKQPAWTKNAGLTAAQRAAATLKQNLSTIRTGTGALQTSVNSDAKQGLISPDIKQQLDKQIAAINDSLTGAGKNALPGIRTSLTAAKAALQDGLAQATDDRGLQKTIAAIKDDLKNKLLDKTDAAALMKQADAYNQTLTDNLISPAARKKVEGNITDLKQKLALDVKLDTVRAGLKTDVAELNSDVKDGLFPPALQQIAEQQAKTVGQKIAEGTAAGAAAAKDGLKSLAATIKEGVADATAIQNFQQTIATFSQQLTDKLDQKLGVPTTYATPAALAAAQAGAAAIIKKLSDGLTGTALTQAKNQLSQYTKTIEDALTGMEAAIEAATTKYESAWSRLATAGDTAFDQVTQDTVTKMQQDITNAVNAMQIQVQTAYGSFMFGGSITQTPAQIALAQLQAQEKQTQLQQALTDAQTAVAAAQGAATVYDSTTGVTTVNPNNPALIAAQQQLAAAQEAIQEDSLQTQADAEQTAAQTQLTAAQTAYQQQQAVAVQAYQQQRALQKQALDDQTQDIETAFENGNIDAQTAFDKLTALYKQNGIDISGLSVTIAGVIYSGVQSWSAPIMQLMTDLQAQIAATEAALGVASTSSAAAVGLSVGAAGRAGIGSGGATNADFASLLPASVGFLPKGNVPEFLDGGWTGAGGPAILHDSEYVVPKKGALVLSGGRSGGDINVNLTVHALDPSTVDWNAVGAQAVDGIYSALLRKKKRNGGTLGLS